MANAKAQINPIQLQGAELNLNKFDAEIKPYSGFNKNNSPFVGGCLSNLYKKNETIEGDVYIAPNGDKWGIDFNAAMAYLTKNGQRVCNCGTSNLIQEKLDFGEETIYVFDDYAYNTTLVIKKTLTGYEGYLSDKYEGSLYYPFTISPGVYITSEQKNVNRLDVKFTVARTLDHNNGQRAYFVAYNTACLLDNGEIWASYNVFCLHKGIRGYTETNIFEENESFNNFKLLSESLQSPCLRADSECFFAPNIYKSNNNYLYRLSSDGTYLTYTSLSGTNIISLDIKDYFFYCDNNIKPHRDAYSLVACFVGTKSITYAANTDVTKLLCFELSPGENNSFAVVSDSHHNFSFTKKYTSNTNVSLKTHVNFTESYAVSLCYFLSDKKFAVGVCDFQTGAVELKEDHFEFNTGAVSNGIVLSNNGIITGLCSRNNYILVTEWNSVVTYCPGINFDGYNFTYKNTDGEWYRVSHK